MKTCTSCFTEKPVTEFNFKNRAKNIRSAMCKACHKIYRDNHYRKNRKKRIAQAKARRHRHRLILAQVIIDHLMANPCIDCGETDLLLLEFDHRSDKHFNISAINTDVPVESLKAEIAKCDVRCVRCHRIKTVLEGRHGILRSLKLKHRQQAL